MMKRQLQGISIILCSILLMLGFKYVGWDVILDFDILWSHIFMITGIAGLILCFVPEKKAI